MIEIVAIRDETTRYWLRVDLKPNGDLVLEGQDLSPRLAGEYEYWYTVKAADVPKLLASLGAPEATDLTSIASLLETRFAREHGISTSTAFKAWCKEREIPYDFFVY